VGDDPNGPNGPNSPNGPREPNLAHLVPEASQDAHGQIGPGAVGPVEPRDETADELERQAREALRMFRESAGELGTRVRDVLDRASTYWQEAGPEPPAASAVPIADDLRARELARRWVAVDFLVDPELPEMMTVAAARATRIGAKTCCATNS